MPTTADQGFQPVDLAREPDFTLGNLQVRPSSREVVSAGECEVLEPRVMQALVVLARRRGQVVSRDQLIEACWAGRVVGEDAINRCIAKVRRLAEAHGSFSVETIARVGYRLTGQASDEPKTAEGVARPAEARAAVGPPPDHAPSPSRRSRWIVGLVVAALAIVAVYVGIAQMRARERAQQVSVLTQVAALIGKDQYGAAFALAWPLSRSESARANPVFAELWRQIVVPMKPLVSQDGASVYFKAYDDADGAWIDAGTTPLKEWVDAPRGALRLKVTKEGFRAGYFVVAVPGPSVQTGQPRRFPFDRPSVPLELVAEGKLPDDMVYVPRTDVPVYLSGWSTNLLGSDRHDIPAFAIARTEVTNREFKEFIDAGGYEAEQYWQDLKFMYRAQALTWPQARKLFVDATGRPGPAGWQLSTYPRGQDDLPVVGISWYEAVAYARFRKQMLPTDSSLDARRIHSIRPDVPNRRRDHEAEPLLCRRTGVGSQRARARAVGHVSHGRQRARVGLELRRRRCSGARQRLAGIRVELRAHLHRGPYGATARPRLAPDAHAG